MATNFSKNGIIQGVIDFFCLVCETNILSKAECEAHMNTAEHEENFSITAYYKEFKEDCIRKIKNKYFCELCNKYLPLLPRVRLHVEDPKHIDNKNIGWLKRVDGAIVAFNKLVIDDTAWHGFSDESCIICNIECDDNDIHKKLPSHILNLHQMKVDFDKDKNIYRKIDEFSFQCLTCNVMQNVKDITNHFDSPTHQHLLEISYETYERSKVCTKLNCKPKDNVNKSVDQTDVYLHFNYQIHVENPTETTKNVFKYTFGDISEEELFKILKVNACTKSNCKPKDDVTISVEQSDICLPSYNQVDTEYPAEIERNIPETIKLEPNDENIETNSKGGLKNAAEDITQKLVKYTFGNICDEELFKILKVKACTKSNCKPKDDVNISVEQSDICLPSYNQVDTEYPAEIEQNIPEKFELEPNEENIETNSKGGSKNTAEDITQKLVKYTFGDICDEELFKILKVKACTKSNCEPQNIANKSVKQTDACLLLNNQVDVKNPAESEQNIPDTIKVESNEKNAETNSKDGLNHEAEEITKKVFDSTFGDIREEELFKIVNAEACTKSNWKAKDSVNKSDERTDVCLALNDLVDIENSGETEHNNAETIELEPNEKNIVTNSTYSMKSNCEHNNGVNNSDKQSDVCLLSNNQLDVDSPVKIEQNIPETIELEPNEENNETNSIYISKANCKSKDSVDKSDEQTDICLHLNNQVDKENRAETEQNLPETIALEENAENIESNSKDCSKSNREAKDTVNKSDEQTEVCLPLKNQTDIENSAETEQKIYETGKIEPNEKKIETNSIDSSKSNCEHNNGVNNSDKQSDVCLLSNNQVNIENPAETKQNITETCKIELNDETIETNSINSSKSNCKSKDSVDKSDGESDICVHLNNQVDKENRADTEQNISESISLDANAENIESKSKDCLKSNWEAIDSVNKSDKQTDVCLPLKNQTDIENSVGTEQKFYETGKIEPNEEKIETNSIDSSKSSCEHNNGVNRSDKQSDVCLLSNNQVNIENPAETKQNITETCKIELNDETIETNSINSSKSNCKSKDSVDKSDEESDICLHLNNQVDKENRSDTEQNIFESIELEANAENIESNSKDCLKSNWEAIDSVNKSDEQTDVCLPSNNQADIENTAETEHNNHETIELEPNNEHIETNSTDSSKSNYEIEDGIIKSVEPTDVCLPSNNQVHIENPAETKQNIFEADKIECNEEKIETNSIDSSKSICEHNNVINRSDKQSDVCLLSNNQVNIENPAETKQNITQTCKIELNEKKIETNSMDSSKSNCKSKDSVDKSDEESDICEHLNNQVEKENRADTEPNISRSIELEANAENIESNSKDCLKSNWEAIDSVNKSDEQTDVCQPLNNQADIENTAETEHNNHETIELEPNDENIETNSTDSSKTNYETEDGIIKSVEPTQNIFETDKIESNEEKIETNSIDSSKSICEHNNGVNRSDKQSDVCLLSNNQVNIENPAETKQNIIKTCKIELNEETIETNSMDSSKSNCKSKDTVDKSDEESDICLHLNNQVHKENRADTEQNISESIELEANAQNIKSNSKDCSKSNWEAKGSANKSDEETEVFLPLKNQAHLESPAETEHNNPVTIKLKPNEDNIETNSRDGWNHEAEEIRKKVFGYIFGDIREEELFKTLNAKACMKSNWEPKDSVNKSDEQTGVCLPSKNQVDIESSAETEQNIPENFELEPNDENIETNSKDGSKDATEETIKNVFEYKSGIWKNETFKVRKVSDCITLDENYKPWCTICNWIVDSSAVAEHLNGRHHKRQKAKRNSKKFANTKICTENNNIDCHEKISNYKSNNNIEISLGMKTAFCKKCSVNLCYGNNFVKRHILEHFEKDKNIDEDSIIFSIEEEPVKIETLFSSSVLPECNKIENTSKLNGNESVKIDKIPENDKVRLNDKVRQENTQITEETLIQEINKLIHKIEKVPTHSFIDYLIYAKNSMQGVNFCDIIINNNIYIHYTSFSFITVSRDYFKCHACDEIFTIFTLQEHFLSTKHDVAIRDTPVLVQYVSEFIREIRPGYIHCGFCNAIAPMDDIETHLNSVDHKECKGIALWRLHLYQPLIAKTGFQTVYAKNGISKALSFRNLI